MRWRVSSLPLAVTAIASPIDWKALLGAELLSPLSTKFTMAITSATVILPSLLMSAFFFINAGKFSPKTSFTVIITSATVT